MLRTSILVSIALISAGFASQPALAEEVKHQTKDAVEGKCNENDGTFWATPDGATYGCGYKDGGGIICDKGGGNIGPWCEEESEQGAMNRIFRGSWLDCWASSGWRGSQVGRRGVTILPR